MVRGFEYKLTSALDYEAINVSGTATPFNHQITGLIPNTQYTFRSFVKLGAQTFFGTDQYFTTLSINLQTLSATNVARNAATLNGTIEFGDAVLTQQGFLLSNNGNVDTIYTNIQGNNISHHISGLTANTSYQYRTFAIASNQTYFGQYVTFTSGGKVMKE